MSSTDMYVLPLGILWISREADESGYLSVYIDDLDFQKDKGPNDVEKVHSMPQWIYVRIKFSYLIMHINKLRGDAWPMLHRNYQLDNFEVKNIYFMYMPAIVEYSIW